MEVSSIPFACANAGAESGSSVSRATLNGFESPIAIAWPISGPAAFSLASMFAGDMFLPAALMMSSFLRSTIFRKPSSSNSPTSPVWSQPSSSIVSRVFSSLLR